MFWYLVKISEDENTIIYSYGFDSREQTGEFSYNKKTKEIEITKLADEDSDIIVKKFFIPHIYKVIIDENAPAKRMIAIS